MRRTLWYIHDPMCSWCYAFAPMWARVASQLPESVAVARLLGGLAPDTTTPMPEPLRRHLEATWHRIEQQVPGTRFNFEFWRRCVARRATYPACRAVIAAREQGTDADAAMTGAIQRAYYREARNPSDDTTLIALAGEIGLDAARFARRLNDPSVQDALQGEVAAARAMGVAAFPGLVLTTEGRVWPIPVDYRQPGPTLAAIDRVLRGVVPP